MNTSAYKTFGVTLAFAAGSLLITLALYALVELNFGGELLRGIEDWPQLATVLLVDATVAGLVVDLLRFASEVVVGAGDQRRTHDAER